MELSKFVEKHNLVANDIWIHIENGKKYPIGEKNNSKPEEIRQDVITNRPNYYINDKRDKINLNEEQRYALKIVKSIYLKHTSSLFCFDVDDPSIQSMNDLLSYTDTFKDCPWTQGNTKGIHIYFYICDMKKYKNQINICQFLEGDLLKTNNVWETTTKLVHNGETIPTFSWDEIKNNFKVDSMNFEQEKKIKKQSFEIISLESHGRYEDLLFNVIGNPLTESGEFVITRPMWLKIGGALKHNQFPMELFQRYTAIADENADVTATWESLDREIHINAIQNIAKLINPEGFQKWISRYTYIDFTSASLADYFISLNTDKFVNVNGVLYYYNGVYWERDDDRSSLTKFFDKTFIQQLKNYYYAMIENNTDIDKSERTTFLENINNLRNVQKRKNVISDIVSFSTDNTIEFNTNPLLFAFNNCVFDLKTQQPTTCKYTDYISMTAGYDYTLATDLQILKLDKFIDTIFPDKQIKEDYLIVLATGLCGYQLENLFVASGSGRNGKGVIDSLSIKMMGMYGYNMPVSCLLKEIEEGANPALANLNYKRLVVCSEPEKGKKIKCSAMKAITGEKILPVRGLYEKNNKTILNLTLIMECNTDPVFDEVNPAVLMRIRTTLFENIYYTKAEYNDLDEESKKTAVLQDPYYKTDKFHDENKCVLFNLLLPYFKKFQDNEYRLNPMPKKCAEKCNKYLAISDDIYGWFCEYYEKTPSLEESEPISFTDIYNKFKQTEYWDNLSKADKRRYNRKHFCEQIEKNMFLKKYIKYENAHHNKIKLTKDCIVGWVKL